MKQPVTIRRITTLTLSLVGGASLLAICLFLPARADQNVAGSQVPPRWVQFPLAYYPALNTDVYENVIIWSEYGGDDDHPFTCTLADSNTFYYSPTLTLNWDYLVDFVQFRKSGNDFFSRHLLPPDIDCDICSYNTQTGQITHVTNTGDQDQWPRIYGNWIAFRRGTVSSFDLIAKNLITNDEIIIFTNVGQLFLNIHGPFLVFKHHDFLNDAIYTYNLSNNQLTTTITNTNYWLDFPDIFSQTIVWQQTPKSYWDYDILGYDLVSQTTFTISAMPGNENYPRIDNGIVVWEWQGDIYGYNLATSQRLTITQDAWTQSWPAVSGNLIVWMDNRNGQWDIYGYDIALGETYRITRDPRDEFVPAVWGNLVAYDRYLDGAAAARKMTEFAFLPLSLK